MKAEELQIASPYKHSTLASWSQDKKEKEDQERKEAQLGSFLKSHQNSSMPFKWMSR